MKRTIALLMALLMLLCSMSAFAEMAGGWVIPEDTALEGEAFDAFYAAVGEGSELYPEALLGTQVVAGVNYAVLCAAPQGFEIVYVYHSVSGEDQVVREQLLVPAGEGVPGGWEVILDAEAGEMALEAAATAFSSLDGIEVKEYYILGCQVVAGMNYCVLLRKTPVSAEPVEGWALATVYVDLNGNVSITSMEDVVLSLYAE